MKKAILTLSIALLSCSSILLAQDQNSPAPKHEGKTLLLGGTAHLGNGDVIQDAAIGYENGIITFVGSALKAKSDNYDEVIDTKGKHIYPGFIAPNSTLGLQEIGAVRATRDQYEIGTFRPNVRAVIAFNTESDITPTVRSNGVLMGQITPRGGMISGSSAIVQFDAWNWEDAAMEMTDGVHMNWPRMHHVHEQQGKAAVTLRKSYEQQLHEIQRFFRESEAYSKGNGAIKDLKYEAMRGLFNGELCLYVHANDYKQLVEAVQLKRDFGIERLCIVGGYDAWMAADLLRDNQVSVMLYRVHELPEYAEDDVNLPYKLPKLLSDEGVLFCLQNSGDMEQMGTRNLPFYAGTAAAYGLTYEQAVMSITLSAAKILGIDDRVGSLEVGKYATIIVSDGDALDMMSNNIVFACISGRAIDLDNRQKLLYRKYKAKYE